MTSFHLHLEGSPQVEAKAFSNVNSPSVKM